MGFFGAAHGWGRGGGQKAYPTMMKPGTVIPYPKTIQKYMNFVTHHLSSADISIYQQKSANFAISRNTDIDIILIHNSCLF